MTDPANPVWLSTSRIDGRFYSPSYDFWESFVFDHAGMRYACLVSSHNGVYILNVTDPKAPLRVSHITVPIPHGSDNYVLYRNGLRNYAFPFDRYKGITSPIGAVVCDAGALYLAGALTDLHVLPYDGIEKPVENPVKSLSHAPEGGSSVFNPEGQVYAITTDGIRLWAACGSQGFAQLDGGLNPEKWVPTDGCCYDVYYKDGILYAAEGDAGLAAYDPANLELLWRFAPEGRSVKQVRLSPKSRFAVLHMAHNEGWVLRIEDMTVVHSQSGRAQMYHHYLSNGLIGGRYLCFWANSADEIWLDFGPEDDKASPALIATYSSKTGMVGGIADYRGAALATTSTGLLHYDPAANADLGKLERFAAGYGKPTVSGDLLVTTNRLTGQLTVTDISALAEPRELWSATLPGTPETALIHGGAIYVPMGYAGLAKYPLG